MRHLRATLHRLRGLFRGRTLEAEMHEEMQAHLDALTERHRTAGLAHEAARQAALREFGGVTQIQERAREERRGVWIEQLLQDARYAVRGLTKAPTFTFTAVLTLALGIGVNTALFSLYNMVALRPLPVRDPDSLVLITGRTAARESQSYSYAEFIAYREASHVLEDLIAVRHTWWKFQRDLATQQGLTFEQIGTGDMVSVGLVSGNYFSVLGDRAQLGRTFLPGEALPGAAPVIVLSHLAWQTHFQANPQIVGTTFKLGPHVVTVIGVAAPEFSGHTPAPPMGWMPLSWWSDRVTDYAPGGPLGFGLIGRLKPGISDEQAKADLEAIAALRAVEFPGKSAKVSVRLERGLRFINFSVRSSPEGLMAIGLLFFGFALVLVIACTNVANLLLARGVTRQAEIGVRLTLGAGRGRILRQLLTENALLCVLGAIAGLALGSWTLRLLLPFVVSHLPVDWALETRRLPFFDTTPDLRVMGFTALLTLGATLVAGLLPAWHTVSASFVATMRNEGTAFGRGLSPTRLRQTLVVAQVGICLAMLSCAGVLARNFMVFRQLDPGFDARDVFQVAMNSHAALTDRAIAARQALATVRAIPGIIAGASAIGAAPFDAPVRPLVRLAATNAGASEDVAPASFISEHYFETFGIPLLRGRDFHELDLRASSRAIIVSEALARRLWPGQEATGRTLAVSETAWATRDQPAREGAFRDCEVIGVARDVMVPGSGAVKLQLYLPLPPERFAQAPVFLRPRHDSVTALVSIVRAAEVVGIELQFQQRQARTLELQLMPFASLAIVSSSLGLLALGMASVGLYGVMTFAVNQRMREIGIRLALGATTERVVTLFVREGMRLVAIGLILGLIGGGLLSLVLGKIFYGEFDTFDPAAFAVVTLLFAAIAFFACWLPALRAAKVDPMVSLRAE